MTDTPEAVRLAVLLSADPTKSPVSFAAAALLRRIPELEAEVQEQARLNGMGAEGFTNAAMKWGTECEPLARAAYEAEYGLLVSETGMVTHPHIPMSGASPDGLVSIDGLIEIKCPETKAHIDTILSGEAPSKYIPQMQWQMACTGRAWCDFVSFDPRMPADMQMFVRRVLRDDDLIRAYEDEVIAFLEEVDATVTKLKAWKQAA